jgi:SAM-dependent methyltransferase
MRELFRYLFKRKKDIPLESFPLSPDLFRAYRYFASHPDLERSAGGWVYEGKFYPDYLTVGGAGLAIARTALKYCQGKGIDVGAGFWPLPGSIPVDPFRGPGQRQTVADFEDGTLDYVFSSHCLEHIDRWKDALRNWVAKVRQGGAVFLYLPHPECGIWRPGSPMVGGGHVWTPTPDTINGALTALNCPPIAWDEGPDMMYSFYTCGRKSADD